MKSRRIYTPISIALLFLVISLGIFLMPVFASSDSHATELTIGVPVDRCPMFYLDKDTGEIAGIGVDLMESAARWPTAKTKRVRVAGSPLYIYRVYTTIAKKGTG